MNPFVRPRAAEQGELDPNLYVLDGDEVAFTSAVKLSNPLITDTVITWAGQVSKNICGTTHRQVATNCIPKEYASGGYPCQWPYQTGKNDSCILPEKIAGLSNGLQYQLYYAQGSQYPQPVGQPNSLGSNPDYFSNPWQNGGNSYNDPRATQAYQPPVPGIFPIPECTLSALVPKRSEMIVAKGRRLSVRLEQDKGKGVYSLMNGDKPTGLLVSCRGFDWLPIKAIEVTTPLKVNLQKHNQLKPIKIKFQVPESAPLTPIEI